MSALEGSTHDKTESRLLLLLPAVLGQLWPAERVVIGLRVCKQLRPDLIAHCNSIGVSDCGNRISYDFRRLPQNLIVTLRQRQGDNTQQLAGVLGERKALVHLDLSENRIGAEGMKRLAPGGAGGVQGAGPSRLVREQDW
eukprot:2316076-Rhodomonas_salina.2